ncbi:MAG: hypothetical protein E4H32_01565, partial [Nitrospirales bacterium]
MRGCREFAPGNSLSCRAPIVEVVSMPRPVDFSIIPPGREPMVCLSRKRIDRFANRKSPMTNNLSPLSDADARQIGETTFDRNVVVLAGAGTGKTTLLVNRLLHALLREPHPFRVTEMLALTFTNKAANEIKGRLREALHELFAACQSPSLNGDSGNVKLKEF